MKLSKSEQKYILKWAKKLRATRLLGGECKECGNSNFLQLDFHHMCEKKSGINELNKIGSRWSVLKDEIRKCILLCSNCHAELHCNSNGKHNIKKLSILKDRMACSRCGYVGKNLASLDFHHMGEKRFIISSSINGNIKVNAEDLRTELDRCVVLCKNCHIVEHIDKIKFNKLESIIMSRSMSHEEKNPPVDVDYVVALKKDGLKQIDIARKVGCAKSTVSKIIKENI